MIGLDIIVEQIRFTNWGQVYLGIKRGWLAPEEVINLFKRNSIPYEESRDVRLYLALEKSLFAFLDEVKLFIEEDGFPAIKYHDDSIREIGSNLWISKLSAV